MSVQICSAMSQNYRKVSLKIIVNVRNRILSLVLVLNCVSTYFIM